MNPVRVVLDTDIGGDIDDTWALVQLLGSPEIDLRLAVGCDGDTAYRARLLCKILTVAGRTDVPVGVGLRRGDTEKRNQLGRLTGNELDEFPGTVRQDGVEALIETLMTTDDAVLLCIGPLTNIAEALRREPRLAPRTRLVGMQGSVDRGYERAPTPAAEYNIVTDIDAARAVFAAPWREMVLTPLDTCGTVRLDGARYAAVRDCETPLCRELMENYRVWADTIGWAPERTRTRSSILFDTVAVHLVHSEKWLAMEETRLVVDEQGFTRRSESGMPVRVAIDWTDTNAYLDDLVARLTAR